MVWIFTLHLNPKPSWAVSASVSKPSRRIFYIFHFQQPDNMLKYKFSIIAALLLGLTACDKRLDLEPFQSISEEKALSTEQNVRAALLGTYDAIAQDGMWGGNVMMLSELAGADKELRWVGTFDGPRTVFNHQMIAENGNALDTWTDAYDAINRCNNILSALSILKDETERKEVEGEALFVRAGAYFELVRLYGQPYATGGNNNQPGVPLVLTPTRGIDANSNVSRASVEQVYAQVLADLEKAKAQLPEDNGVRAGKFTAAALLARVNLQMGRYAAAKTNADEVIASGLYSLAPNYADAWNNDDNSVEDIFAIQVSSQDAAEATTWTFYSIPDFGGRDGDIEIEEKHLNLYPAGDTRAALFYEGAGAMRSGKWKNQYRNIPIIRLPEMHLISAECAVRAGQSGDAAYNEVHTRAGLTAKTGVTLNDVLLERRLELAHEGHRLHDIKRLRGTADGLPYNDPKLVFPIPAREIDANPNLRQNEGY
jgi:starch-binding outer membrane protein, SusD/RagB family